ncbi:hypothetical protein EYZ11_007782 [Aspergillus tanneri]|uniref:Arsenite methyltransferase n=1 Tax=Aspergillus tanneri TaxID=1220188 RepID=A0A4V3UNW8_9EURO|nr:hypothetical protein EYZ11_007782 [Aspergillus tanneri]
MDSTSKSRVLGNLRQYYGSTIQSRADLRTSACCLTNISTQSHSASQLREALVRVHPHVQERFYGCGSPIPAVLEGLAVLDLGCGSGRDCYVLSQLVGPRGRVLGVDVSEEQIAVARSFLDWHAQQFGYANVEFKLGQMEDLAPLGIADASIDLVISNCVLNLSVDKDRVIQETFRVLKSGGQLYISDVFANRRIPQSLIQDPVLHGECLAGAWYREDFRRLLASVGCADVRMESQRPISIGDPDVEEKIGFATFMACIGEQSQGTHIASDSMKITNSLVGNGFLFAAIQQIC